MSLFHKTKRGQIVLGDSLEYMKRGSEHVCCKCQNPGTVHSGVRGILAGPPDQTGSRYIERCDICERFCSDEAAGLEYANLKGGGSRFDKSQRVLWTPA